MLRISAAIAVFTAAQAVLAAGITLTRIPTRLLRPDDVVEIRWAEPVAGRLKFGARSGDYTAESSASGTGRLSFVPRDEGMATGVYYAVVVSGSLLSPEFKLMVESPSAPQMLSPANNATIRSGSPTFRWDPIPGVPYYHLILSDQEVRLFEDEGGELQLDGGNLIWQAITPNSSINYGDPDPSGFFDALNAQLPPVMENLEYNWIVLNNYNNHPAYSSIVQAGVFSFRADLDISLSAPSLIAPAADAILSDPVIRFQWSKVNTASAYKVLLSESKEQDGSRTSYLLWTPITTETSIELQARFFLKGNDYFWRVAALDNAGRGVVSGVRNFYYNVPYGILHIVTQTVERDALARVEVEILPLDGTGEIIRLLTTDSGVLDNRVQPGTYDIIARKEGYADTSATVSIGAGETVPVTLRLRPLLQSIRGRVVSESGLGIGNAAVTFMEFGRAMTKTAFTDAGGGFSHILVPGTWYLFAEKSGYRRSDTVAVALPAGRHITLSEALVLRAEGSVLKGCVNTAIGVPILGAGIEARGPGGIRRTATGEGGRFEMSLAAGRYQVHAFKDGFVRSEIRTLRLRDGEIVTLSPDFILRSAAALIAGFISSEKVALPGAVLSAVPLLGAALTASSGALGSYSLSLPEGDWAIRARKQGYVPGNEILFNLSADQTLSDMNLFMTPASAWIKGTVRRNGAPVPGAIVFCELGRDTTRADGSYTLALVPGSYSVDAVERGWLSRAARRIELDYRQTRSGINFDLDVEAGVIEGRVLCSGQPVASARVSVEGRAAVQSDLNGAFWFSLPAGIWDLRASKEGFSDGRFSGAALNAGQTISGVDLSMVFQGAVLRGTILDSRNRPLQNARLFFDPEAVVGGSDRFGNYAVSLDPGTYRARAEKTGYVPATAQVQVSKNQVTQRDFFLIAKGLVYGRVTDEASAPLDDVVVTAAGPESLSTRSDYTGGYQLHLTAGSYRLYVDPVGYNPAEQSLTIDYGDSLQRDFSLSFRPGETARLSGVVRDSQGAPLEGIAIHAGETVISTDASGQFVLDALPIGHGITVRPSSPGRFFLPPQRVYSPLTGDQGGQNFSASLYGDVSGNERISAFDGSLVLRINAEQDVEPHYTRMPRDSIAADVSGNRQVSPYDASLIFRRAAGLISQFPVENPGLSKIAVSARILALNCLDADQFSIHIGDAAGIYSGTVELEFPPGSRELVSISASAIGGTAQFAAGTAPGRVIVVFASAEPLSGSGELCRLGLRRLGETAGMPKLRRAQLDEGMVPVRLVQPPPESATRLRGSAPNPFNESTSLFFDLAGSSPQRVTVTVHNLLGQPVRHLLDARLSGGSHVLRWDGCDDARQPVASGIYVVRLKTGSCERIHKVCLIR